VWASALRRTEIHNIFRVAKHTSTAGKYAMSLFSFAFLEQYPYPRQQHNYPLISVT
jgi:hypothetical protein